MEEETCCGSCKGIFEKVVVWLKQRRVWAAILSIIAIIGEVLGYPVVPQIIQAIAAGLALDSYIRPKCP